MEANMHIDKLKVEIVNLIASKREGDYWDFKQKHHRPTCVFSEKSSHRNF